MLNFSLSVQLGVLRVSAANELDKQLNTTREIFISLRIFLVVEIPIKFSSLYSKSYFLCFSFQQQSGNATGGADDMDTSS